MIELTSPISVPNVFGFGQSVAVSADGKSLGIGVVSLPSHKLHESGSKHSTDFITWEDMISEYGSVYMFQIEKKAMGTSCNVST